MTREEAVALLERYSNYDGMGIPNLAGCKEAMRVAVDALKEAYPELAKSEDERIREDLIGGLMWQRDNLKSEGPHDNNLILPGFCLTVGEQLAYLEKQKEQKPVERSREGDYIIGFVYALLNQIEWKDNWAMSKEECLRRLNNYSPQKPAEWSKDSVKFEEGFKVGRESGLRDGQKYVLNNLDSYGLCKLAEWSERDNLDEAAREIVIKMHPCLKDCTILGDRLTRGQLMALVKAGAEWMAGQETTSNNKTI